MTKKNDRWENDATLPERTDKQNAAVQEATFREFERLKMTPESIRDKAVGKQYAAWLASKAQ